MLPSFNENFANTVIESLAVGTPVLISENVGLKDYIEKNNLGCIFKLNELKNQLSTIYICLKNKTLNFERINNSETSINDLINNYKKIYTSI